MSLKHSQCTFYTRTTHIRCTCTEQYCDLTKKGKGEKKNQFSLSFVLLVLVIHFVVCNIFCWPTHTKAPSPRQFFPYGFASIFRHRFACLIDFGIFHPFSRKHHNFPSEQYRTKYANGQKLAFARICRTVVTFIYEHGARIMKFLNVCATLRATNMCSYMCPVDSFT